MRAVPIGR
ncbi:hypothetical protein N499_1164A, partial [Wolbachia pipientis wVitA]